MDEQPVTAWSREIDLPSERGASRMVTDDLLERVVASGIIVGGALEAPPPAAATAPAQVRAMMQRQGITPEKVLSMVLAFRGRMYRAEVRFVTGADSGIAPHMAHGLLHRSVSFFVEAGASTADALAAATSVSTEACRMGDRKGRCAADTTRT